MNTLAALVVLSANPAVNLLIWLIIAGAVCWFIFTYLPLPQVVRVGLACLIAILLVLMLFGCSTTTSDLATNERNAGLNAAGTQALNDAAEVLGNAAVSALFTVAQSEAKGKGADFMNAASQGLYTQVNYTTTAADVANIVNAFSAGKASQTAKQAAKAAAPILSTHDSPPLLAVNAIAAVIATAAGSPPATGPLFSK